MRHRCAKRPKALSGTIHRLGPALLGVAATLVWAVPAHATPPTDPPTNPSFYIETTNVNTLQTMGCNQAHADTSHGSAESMVILDFGALNADGTQHKLINGIWITADTVVTLAESYAFGYSQCLPPPGGTYQTTVLGVGTNNSKKLNTTNGAAFGRTVDRITQYANNLGTSNYSIWVHGANDIESWGSATTLTPQMTRDWVAGFESTYTGFYINFGSADGCSTSGAGPCGYGWTQQDYYYLSWGNRWALVAPEIYYSSQAKQWDWINRSQNGSMIPEGPLDQHPLKSTSYTSTDAWNALVAKFPQIYRSLEMNVAS